MRIYELSRLGRKVTKAHSNGSEEMRILQWLRNNGSGTDDELEAIGGERWIMKSLKKRGLVKELTEGGR